MASERKTIPVPLTNEMKLLERTINFKVNAIGQSDVNIGSVSIPKLIIMNGGLFTYVQWITLFELEDDDEYDGEMGLNDEEEPMLQIKFETKQETANSQADAAREIQKTASFQSQHSVKSNNISSTSQIVTSTTKDIVETH